MIRGQSVEPRGELGAVLIGELLGMKLHSQAIRRSGLEHLPRLGG